MPPRYSYWTIIADGLPTAFRAADRDELLPTFARIKHKHPDAELKWFARGRLWDAPESARPASRPPSGPSDRSRPATPRGRDWRHKAPNPTARIQRGFGGQASAASFPAGVRGRSPPLGRRSRHNR